uniref:NADPH oxidase 4 n=1 Tax=Amphiprion ocellaris TaxID=80972 RepID=A0AAQ5ZN33_AMPOC
MSRQAEMSLRVKCGGMKSGNGLRADRSGVTGDGADTGRSAGRHTEGGRAAGRTALLALGRTEALLESSGSCGAPEGTMVVSVRSWVANEGGKHLVLMLWLGGNTWLFMNTFLLYSTGQQYHYLYKMLGLGLCISRASASVLNLNCSLVLLPMCRSLLTFVRGTHAVSSRKTRRLLDKSKTFHVACGVAICVFSVVHVSAHLVNVVNFSVSYSDDFPALNLARYRGEDPKMIILIPGITGVLLVLILFLMFTSSSYCIRVSNYEIFWYTHNLFIIFYIILMVHMVGDGWTGFRLQRLYFVWVCRELQSFYWFAELLCALHHKLWQENRPDYFNLKLYISQTDGLQSMSEEKYRPLSSRLLVGRPKWKLLLDEIGKSNKHKRVGVFCCGPKGISRTLHRLCNSARSSGTTFEFNKESFC